MKQLKHWQDPVNGVLGVWLILSPWMLRLQDNRAVTIAFLVAGILLVALAVGAMMLPRAWEEWSGVAVGVLLMASPWLLGFSGITMAVQVALFTGLAAVALALWVLAVDKEYGGWWSRLVG
ncbi:MAG: SPW repeat protein [Pseudomonadota bacterium]